MWAGTDGEVARAVAIQTERCLATYREDPRRVEQDATIEAGIAQGGYGRKQIHELVQNGADAMLATPGQVEVVLTADTLYVANQGSPLTSDGVHALMASHLFRKRGEEIGRFGLGFKSLVAISDGPEVFSHTGSFGFDRESSAKRILEVVPDARTTPLMRLANPIDPSARRQADPVLASLMQWATTVVRVPVTNGMDELVDDLRTFPAEFLLFSPHAQSLILRNAVSGLTRVVKLRHDDGGALELADGDKARRWRVVRQTHRPSAAALTDAGDIAHRESIAVAWAAPLGPKPGVGTFWAFFPTDDLTTLSGIINAPWKLSDDRRNLLEGAFNREILSEVLPAMIEAELPLLVDDDDPCALLDFLPARGREARSWADEALNGPVIDRMKRIRSLPDTNGVLRSPSEMRIHPKDLPESALSIWSAAVPAPEGWIHHSVEQRASRPSLSGRSAGNSEKSGSERRAKAERLLSVDGEPRVATVAEWIRAIADRRDVDSSATAINLVRELVGRPGFEIVRDLPVVLLEDNTLAAARHGRVFLRSSAAESGTRFIHPGLAALPEVVRVLGDLGVRLVDRAGELRQALAVDLARLDWSRVWLLARQCDHDQAHSLFVDELGSPLEGIVRVRNRDGRFVKLSDAFLPGGVLQANEPKSSRFAIDVDFHRDDIELLERFGAVSQPVLRSNVPAESWLISYGAMIREDYIAKSTGAKPHIDKLVVEGVAPPWPLNHLPLLPSGARAAMTLSALTLTSTQPWKVRHATNSSYPVKNYKAPALWWLRKHGEFATGVGPVPVGLCMAPAADLREDIFPVADVSQDTAEMLGLALDLDDLPEASWDILLKRCRMWESERRTALYTWAAWKIETPEVLLVEVAGTVREFKPEEVAVARTAEDFRSLADQRIPVLLVDDDEDVAQLIDGWGLDDGKALLEQELTYESTGEPLVLTDAYPRLRLHQVPQSIKVQMCESIELVTVTNNGTRSRSITSYLNDDVLLTTAREPAGVLRHASDALQLRLSADDIRAVIDHLRSQELEKAIADVRSIGDPHEKLAALLGVDAMVSKTPGPALEAVRAELGREPTGPELAKLVVAVFGVRVLSAFSGVLEEKGLTPPSQWVGSSSTRRFVEDLGFPVEYAGFVSDSKPAMQAIDGPASLPELHAYQQIVTSAVKAMLRGGTGAARGLVSLPTGAGKTRVAVQALVEEIAEGNLEGPIVWIAQSEELCEQAIEAWAFIWRARGGAGPLHISRLWASNDVSEVGSDIQLVVATPHKLLVCKPRQSYQWLTEATVVVVDEAHTSVAPMYTEVLDWLGLGRSRSNRKPLIGLTATPFRNTNEAETRQLASRYDKNRLDAGAFKGDPHEYLQRERILARAEQKVLRGAELVLDAAELASTQKFRDLPKTALTKLGTNVERNETIIKSIEALPKDWTVLVFATSVDNSRVLASLLSFHGISAVSIDTNTDAAARRHYIAEFKAGRIRVITNYGVLAQGFDAPAVRAVYVTRPTYSANLYQQMIGRGLRGPKNGGSDQVLIVNVEDNIAQYGEALAFTDFDHVWTDTE